MPDKYIVRVEMLHSNGNSSIFVNGVDPGFINDLIPFALASTCQRIEQVRCMEIADYATYDGAEVMHYMGSAGHWTTCRCCCYRACSASPGAGPSVSWRAGLGIELDEITESYQREPAPEDFDIAVGRVAKGTMAALQFEIRGMVDGHPAIVVEHITRLREDLRPELAATRPARWLVSGGNSRRAVLRRRHLPGQPQGRPQPRRDRRRRGPDRQRHPGGGRGAARNQDDARLAVRHR